LGLLKKFVLLIPFGVAIWKNEIQLFIFLWVICNYITALINMVYLQMELTIPFKKQLLNIINGLVVIVPFILFFEWLDIKLPVVKITYIITFSVLYFAINWLMRNPTIQLILSLMSDIRKSFVGELKNVNETS
jgi:hypothetical protein